MRIPLPRSLGPQVGNTAVTAVLGLWALPDVPWWWRPPGHAAGTLAIVGYLALALLQSLPFLAWRRAPLLVLAGCAAVYLTRGLLHRNQSAAGAAVLVAAYGLGAYGSRRWLPQLAAAASLATAAGIGLFDNYHRTAGVGWALLGAAFLVGDAATARRGETTAAVHAAQLAERAHIARELHDILAHQLSAIVLQAGAARLAAPADPVPALAAIEQLGRESLTEVGHLLGTLRHDQDAAPHLRPTPTLAELDTLLSHTRAAGTPVELAVHGDPPELTPGLQLSVYRIVQEALTNATRHSPGAPVRVRLAYTGERVDLTVVNGPGLPAPAAPHSAGGGRGLLGIRERVALYGGTTQTTTHPDGSYELRASLPHHPPPAG